MTNRLPSLAVLLLPLALAGCPQPQGAGQNPTSFWLGIRNSETDIVLVDSEPPPF